jgi:hypothetical protein
MAYHRAALHRRHDVAFERQRGHQPDHRLLREGEAVHQLGQVVFEEALALGLEERDGLLIVGRIGGGKPEIDLHAALVERHPLEPEGDGAILGRRERLGIEDLQLDLALGARGVFLEHLAHALGIDAVGRDLVAELRRKIKAHDDRLVDLGERVERAGGERVEMLVGEVDAGRAQQPVGDDVDGDEQHQCRREREERCGAAGE